MRIRTPNIETETRPMSIRMPLAMIDEMHEKARAIGYSSNHFALMSIRGIMDMIDAKEWFDKEPEVVAIARFMKSRKEA